MAKATKKTANYRAGAAQKQCSQCTMFDPPHACTSVQGKISPSGLCDYFKRSAAGRRKRWYGDKANG